MDNDILFFFGEHMEALPMYERLENAILTRIPDVKIKVAKTQITFAGRRGFASVPGSRLPGSRISKQGNSVRLC